jgi:hypothetical protein
VIEKHPSGAKAAFIFSAICGTAKAVPFQSFAFSGTTKQLGEKVSRQSLFLHRHLF